MPVIRVWLLSSQDNASQITRIMKKGIYSFIMRYREIALYCLIGYSGASLDFAAYVALSKFFGLHYQCANLISVSIGITNNFFLNFFFNFKVRDRIAIRFVRFYCIGMFGWMLSAAMLWMLVEVLSINALVAKIGTIFFVTAVQFVLNKFITFRKHENRNGVENG